MRKGVVVVICFGNNWYATPSASRSQVSIRPKCVQLPICSSSPLSSSRRSIHSNRRSIRILLRRRNNNKVRRDMRPSTRDPYSDAAELEGKPVEVVRSPVVVVVHSSFAGPEGSSQVAAGHRLAGDTEDRLGNSSGSTLRQRCECDGITGRISKVNAITAR